MITFDTKHLVSMLHGSQERVTSARKGGPRIMKPEVMALLKDSSKGSIGFRV